MRALLKERDLWRDKYATAAQAIGQLRAERNEARDKLRRLEGKRAAQVRDRDIAIAGAAAKLTAAESELTKVKSELEATAARELELRQIVRVDYEGVKVELARAKAELAAAVSQSRMKY